MRGPRNFCGKKSADGTKAVIGLDRQSSAGGAGVGGARAGQGAPWYRRSVMVHASASASWAELFRRGQVTYPRLALREAEFVAHLSGILARTELPLASAGDLRIGDLYLACACARRTAGSAETFREEHGGAIRTALRALLPIDSADEVEQQVYEDLLLGRAEKVPRIASYGGQGPLGRWVVVVAQRAGLMALRSDAVDARLRSQAAAARVRESALDHELTLIKALHLPEVDRALKLALQELSPRDRIVLHLHLTGDAGVVKLGRMYNVNASTVSRWLSKIRETLSAAVRRHLTANRGLSTSEMDSLIDLVQSQLDFSVSDLLPTPLPG